MNLAVNATSTDKRHCTTERRKANNSLPPAHILYRPETRVAKASVPPVKTECGPRRLFRRKNFRGSKIGGAGGSDRKYIKLPESISLEATHE